MALERRNPLPRGVYWLDVFGDNRHEFSAWRTIFAKQLKVHSTESFDSKPARDWVKFEVLAPIEWDAKTFGYPTIIPPGANVNASADTVQRPPPEKDPLDELGDALGSAGSATTKLVGAALMLGGALVVINMWAASRGGR